MDVSPLRSGPVRAADGCIRLTYPELKGQTLAHCISGLDEYDGGAHAPQAMSTEITGYTEWVSTAQPTLSLGWDWRYAMAGRTITLRRLGSARSNILLLDCDCRDMHSADSDSWLDVFIDSFAWQPAVLGHIALRYQPHGGSA